MGQGKSTTAQAPTGPGVEAYKEFAAPAATALANTFGGGGRRAVYEAEFDTGNLANQNQLIAQMMQQGYGQAQAQTMAQIQQQQGALGAGAAGLSGVGATDTALQGAQMAGDYGEFMRQQDDPYNKLNAFTALASGSPTGATSTETYKPGLFEYLKVAAQAAS